MTPRRIVGAIVFLAGLALLVGAVVAYIPAVGLAGAHGPKAVNGSAYFVTLGVFGLICGLYLLRRGNQKKV